MNIWNYEKYETMKIWKSGDFSRRKNMKICIYENPEISLGLKIRKYENMNMWKSGDLSTGKI